MLTSKQIFEEAQSLFMDGKLDESIKAFTEAINSGEKSEVSYLSRGVAYLRNNDKENAISDFTEVEKMNDQNVRAHFYNGIAYLTKKSLKEAISEFDRTIELNPEHGAAFFARGSAYAELGNEELATKNIKTAISFSETNVAELQETIGLWRTEFDKALSIAINGREAPEMTLTHDEYHKVTSWLEKGYKEEKFH